MKNLKRFLFLLLAFAMLCTSVPALAQEDLPNTAAENNKIFLPLATGGSNAASNPVVSLEISEAEQKAAMALWTRSAIVAAQPLEMIAQFGPEELNTDASPESEFRGFSGSTPGGRAAADADSIAQAAYPLDWDMSNTDIDEIDMFSSEPRALDGTAGVYTSYTISDSALQKMYPHRWIGRLTFKDANGNNWYCSGTAISGNVMLTAAHCLYDTTENKWRTSIAFTPAYRNGNAPYGSFASTNCWVLTSWVNLSGNYALSWARHDVGVCEMGQNSARQTLNNAVGWMGREWNASYTRHVYTLGYPARDTSNNLLPNAGQYLRTCVAETRQGGTEYRGMGCNLGGGISGGPWTIGYAVSAINGWATGVNSGIQIGSQNVYGARFNTSNIVPLCNSAGC